MGRRLILILGCLAVVATACTNSDNNGDGDAASNSSAPESRTPTVAEPTVSEALPDGFTLGSPPIDVAARGYEQVEYFLEGTATAYSAPGPLPADGMWTVQPASQAPYTTRVVVTRPVDADDFSGTAVVEWLNVTGNADAAPSLSFSHVELLRRGHVHVAVSAQQVGLDATKTADPARYAELSHPGDSYSYDMYSQAGQALRSDADTLLGGLAPKRVLSTGESQSALRLVTYINAVHPLAHVFDGFLVHSRFGPGAPLSQAPLPQIDATSPTKLREDSDVPTLVFQTETEIDALAARQPDSDTYRLWEVAGTAHFDQYGMSIGSTDAGDVEGASAWFEGMVTPSSDPIAGISCGLPINAGPQTYVLRAAIAALDAWVRTGTPPASAPRLETEGADPATLKYALDERGIARGGIRTPAVDAPVARLSGMGQPTGSADPLQMFCLFFGTTVPFSTEELTALYGDHDGFVDAWSEAVEAVVDAGFLLEEDAGLLQEAAENSSVLA